MTAHKIHEAATSGMYLLLLGALVPPSALDILGSFQRECIIDTPYGNVGPLALRGKNDGHGCWIQPYSGLSTRTDPRATLFAAAQLGVASIISWDMGVALNPALKIGQTALISDYLDFTRLNSATFLTQSAVNELPASVLDRLHPCDSAYTDLYDKSVVAHLRSAMNSFLLTLPGMVYVGVDGPRRETAAEATMYRLWGGDILGQNLIPEVFLAREIAINFTGLVTIGQVGADRLLPDSKSNAAETIAQGIEQTIRILSGLLSH